MSTTDEPWIIPPLPPGFRLLETEWLKTNPLPKGYHWASNMFCQEWTDGTNYLVGELLSEADPVALDPHHAFCAPIEEQEGRDA